MGAQGSQENQEASKPERLSKQESFQDVQSVYSVKVLESRCLFSSPITKELKQEGEAGKWGSTGSGSTDDSPRGSVVSQEDQLEGPPTDPPPGRDLILLVARVANTTDLRMICKFNPDMEACSRLNIINKAASANLVQLGEFTHDETIQKQLLKNVDLDKFVFGKYRSKATKNTYEGTIYEGVPHGYGIFISSGGDYLEGYFKAGFAFGKCLRSSAKSGGYNGYIGESMVKQGRGKFLSESQELTTATWQEDKANGWVEIVDVSNMELLYKGKLIQGRKEGKSFFRDRKKGTLYVGDFRDGLYYGFGKLVDSEGEFKGYFLNGLKDGPGHLKKPEGGEFQGIWSKGVFQGYKPNSAPELFQSSSQRVPYTSKPMPPNPNRA